MKLLSVFLENYGSFYGRHEIPLADLGLVSVLGENLDDPRAKSNGAGKSTVSDALDWCLFGDNPRGDAAAAVVNEQAKNGCCVTTYVLDDAGTVIRITRTRDYAKLPNGPRLWVGEQERTALDAKETQRSIEAVLGIDREVFHAAVLFAQGDQFRFADATDAQRKEILTRIIPEMGEVDRVLRVATDKAAEAATQRMRAEMEVNSCTLDLQNMANSDPRAEAQRWEEWRAVQFRNAEAQWLESKARLEAMPVVAPVATPVPRPAPRMPSLPLTPASNETNAAAMRLLERNAEHRALRSEFVAVHAAREKVKATGTGTCSQCRQPITAAHVEAEIAALSRKLSELEAAGLAAKAALALAEKEHADCTAADTQRTVDARRAYEAAVSARNAEWERISAENTEAQVAHVKAIQHANARAQVHAKVDADWRAMEEARAAVNPWLSRTGQWEASVAAATARKAAAESALASITAKVRALDFWKEGLGTKGLKSYVLDARIAEMSAEANRWVQLLTGGTVWVQFATQREVGKGKNKHAVDDLSIRILRSNPDGTVTERAYRSWSGGEKYRIALGIDFGLARLVAKRASRAYDILVLDEVFQHSLDSTGKEAVAEMLLALSKEKSTILVIDHDASFQNMFNARMVVRKQHRRSRIVNGVTYVADESTDTQGNRGANHVLANHPAFPR